MKLDVRTILVLWHPDLRQVLLLRRSSHKKLFPNLITGIGGAVELTAGEGADLEASVLRELEEETQVTRRQIDDLRLRLTTILSRDNSQVILHWYTARLMQAPPSLSCTEGELGFFPPQDLPLQSMVPTAAEAIPFILSLAHDDHTSYSGIYQGKNSGLLTNRPISTP
jgi:8-oxo-dGTP diphosphatase